MLESRKGFAFLRIAFGVVWAIDAYFKWQPGFISGFSDIVSGALINQPPLIQLWIQLWVNSVSLNPQLFATITAIVETILAVTLLFGIFTRYAIYVGIIFSFLIWSTAEGLSGPYKAGSTDIGTAIIYIFVFVALLLGRSWEAYSLDAKRHSEKGRERIFSNK